MRQFMQQRYQEAVRIEVGIDAYPVVRGLRHRVAVIAQYAPAIMGERKVYGMRSEERRYLLKCPMRQKLF